MTRWGSRRRRPRSRLARFLDYLAAAAFILTIAFAASRFERFAMRDLSGSAKAGDGDSLTLGAERVRLKGIDAPELAQLCVVDGREYPCGRRSLDALAATIDGRAVSCEGWERDRYGRLLAVCSAGGVDLNRAQVASGWAVAYGSYRAEEATARAAGSGIWAGTFEWPADYRRRKGEEADAEHGFVGSIGNLLRELFR